VSPNGGTVLPQNAPVEPFFSEIKLNFRLNTRILGGTARSNGFPRGHANLNNGHPGLGEYIFDGVLVTEVSFASLDPNMIKNEAPEDVERLPWVREATGVISEVPRGIIFSFEDGLSEEDERPSDVELLRSFPLFPYSLVRFPSFERPRAFEQTMLRGFLLIEVIDFAVRGDSHVLKPRSNWETLVESDPNESVNYARF